ncbi:hypothetical protein CSKR_105224 [Clonorchis sinensis]|uniref:Uncharacterized protein n=1 Tax=Clonorchis sinensis TaxID=79923 RepID=A0A419PDD9_CLOSI|nr:hypothetical protein CSKR_105224 [Clonorchis sinensis]
MHRRLKNRSFLTAQTQRLLSGGGMTQWLQRELTEWKVPGSTPISASRLPMSRLGQPGSIPALVLPSGNMAGGEMSQWIEREFTDRKVRGSNLTSASRLSLSRVGQPDSIPALMLPSGGMAVRHRKSVTAERFSFLISVHKKLLGIVISEGYTKKL